MSVATSVAPKKSMDPKAPAKADYVMPPAQLGPCVWMPAPGGEKLAGVITRVEKRGVHVAVVVPESRAVIPKDAVRHCTDPDVAKLLDQAGGVWDYTDEQKQIKRLLAELSGPDSK